MPRARQRRQGRVHHQVIAATTTLSAPGMPKKQTKNVLVRRSLRNQKPLFQI